MTSRNATIRNELGIHLRPSAAIYTEIRAHAGTVWVTNASGQRAEMNGVLALLSLGIACGETITVEVEGGEDAEGFCRHIADLFETDFDFPPR
jgi:phosphocarrier protein